MTFRFFQIANVFNRTVRLVFPEMEDLIHDDMNRFMVPQDGLYSKTYNIMWTTCDNIEPLCTTNAWHGVRFNIILSFPIY